MLPPGELPVVVVPVTVILLGALVLLRVDLSSLVELETVSLLEAPFLMWSEMPAHAVEEMMSLLDVTLVLVVSEPPMLLRASVLLLGESLPELLPAPENAKL